MSIRSFTPLGVAIVSLLAVALPVLADSNTDALKNARDATAAFQEPAAAIAGGYELLTDAADVACIEMPAQGAMGVHYVKGALVQSGTIDAARPQALVYEVASSGRLQLVALEYVVLQSTWEATHTTPPTLFGEKFILTTAGNRFGLPAYYSLHSWIYKHNPSGTFNPWNPNVHCGAALRSEDDTGMGDMGRTADPLSMEAPRGDR